MTHILSLISAPQNHAVEPDMVSRLANWLPASGAATWLDPGRAVEVHISASTSETDTILQAARRELQGLPVDVNLLAVESRRKRLLVADMDSTMIEQECVDELADLAGVKEHVAAITERAMNGEIAFAPASQERVALLRGLPLEAVDRVLRQRITLMPGARQLVRTMRAHGAYAALVSGGFTRFTGPIAERIGFDEHRGNVLDTADGALLGTVEEPILGPDAKRAALLQLRERLELSPEDTLAVGDGANDLAMISEAGLGVAFRAKPAVAAAAAVRIDHGDLTALLYLQGYRRQDVVG